MKTKVNKNRRGFSLVELLAVVLILAVLAGVAVPVYLNQRTRAATRTCAANIAAIAKAESTRMVTTGAYTATIANLVGGTEGGIASTPTCPLAGSSYTLTLTVGELEIACPDHAGNTRTLSTPAAMSGL